MTYTYHPMPKLSSSFCTLPTNEATSSFHKASLPFPPYLGCSLTGRPMAAVAGKADLDDWEADMLCLELELAPSVLCLHGSLLRNLIHVKVIRNCVFSLNYHAALTTFHNLRLCACCEKGTWLTPSVWSSYNVVGCPPRMEFWQERLISFRFFHLVFHHNS